MAHLKQFNMCYQCGDCTSECKPDAEPDLDDLL